MKLTRTLLYTTLIFCMSGFFISKAQDVPVHPSITGVGHYHGLTPPLRELPTLTPEQFRAMQESDYERNEELQNRSYPFAETALPKGPDPVWQQAPGTVRGGKGPILNIAGQQCPYYPPDPNGTAGPLYYMQAINTVYAIYDKTDGSLVAGPTDFNELFAGVPGSSCNDGDPLVLYDEQADRWLAVEFSICGSNDRMLVAVSQTNDPTDSWHAYSFDVADMPDYEKFGIWQDGYYMGTNNSSGNDIYVFEREPMLNGGTAQFAGFNNPWRPSTIDGFMCVPPLDNDGPAAPAGEPGMFITINDDAIGGGSDQLWLYELTADWTNVSNSTFVRSQQINVPAFNSNFGNNWDNIKQPGTNQELDGIPMVIMNRPQYRNFGAYETIVCCHTVDLDNTDHAGIRWYELRRNGGDWAIRQAGTFGPDQHSRWMGSIVLNGQNEIGLGYSISSTTEYPGIRYCGQSASAYAAANGLMDIAEEVIYTGAYSQKGVNRWGDYTDLSVDPENDRTFWYTNMYIGTSSGARYTRIASFEFAPQALEASFTASTVSPCMGNTVNFTDLSVGTPTSWAWTFEGGNPPASTDQNPVVSYIASGTYDVELIIANEMGSDTLLLTDYIRVVNIPGQAGVPEGPLSVCKGGSDYFYAIHPVPEAAYYQWFLEPSLAGTVTASDTSCVLAVAPEFVGPISLSVQAQNNCGAGPVSEILSVNSLFGPALFNMPSDGGICEGGPGFEITLDGSEAGTTYELFLEGAPTGIIREGTGGPVSFGFQTILGNYTVMADNMNCMALMNGSTVIYYLTAPELAGDPQGETELCNSAVPQYTTSGAPNATYYIWRLDPETAGTIAGNDTIVSVIWNPAFAGQASLTVQGADQCGPGPVSGALLVNVIAAPTPQVKGQAQPCSAATGLVYAYTTLKNSENTYIWKVIGGTLITPQGNANALASWDGPGTGYIMVTETAPNGCATTDTLEVAIADCTGLPESEQDQQLRIYPNPVEDLLVVEGNTGEPGLAAIRIFNNSGQELIRKEIMTDEGKVKVTISTASLPAGTYTLHLIAPRSRVLEEKFVKL